MLRWTALTKSLENNELHMHSVEQALTAPVTESSYQSECRVRLTDFFG